MLFRKYMLCFVFFFRFGLSRFWCYLMSTDHPPPPNVAVIRTHLVWSVPNGQLFWGAENNSYALLYSPFVQES